GRMLAGVAHDLRNPMTVISGYAQIMAVEEQADLRRARCERVLHQIDEMTAMVADLLAFARGDSRLKAGEVDVARLGAELEETLGVHCTPRGILLEIEAPPGRAHVDPSRARRIITNLAKNA